MVGSSSHSIGRYCEVTDARGIGAKHFTIDTDIDLTLDQFCQATLTKLKINGKRIPIKMKVRTFYLQNCGAKKLEEIQIDVKNRLDNSQYF